VVQLRAISGSTGYKLADKSVSIRHVNLPRKPWLEPESPTALRMAACECTVVMKAASARAENW
jgi:hypothetical protein